MTLPVAFIDEIRPYLPSGELEEFIHALTETEPTTCLRYNRAKTQAEVTSPIGWNSSDGTYLTERPNFTLDPLLHAGAYYVQEASSQFVTHVIRQLVHEPITALDLCAAPGGKSTAMLSALPEGSLLVSNEIDRRRARILAENVTKWGNPNVIVTCNAPKDFSAMTHTFDVILTDVPCSGEGMFRKDEGAVKDWSMQKVNNCVNTQHDILDAIWPALKPEGLLIYSTCTFNIHEDEEMLKYICEQLGAETIDIQTEPAWNIHKPLIGNLPCYRFMPHTTKGEGLFLAVVRKKSEGSKNRLHAQPKDIKRKEIHKATSVKKSLLQLDQKTTSGILKKISCESTIELTPENNFRAIPKRLQPLHNTIVHHGLYILQSGIEMGKIKGKDIIPAHALAVSIVREATAYPTAEVNLETALQYLRHENITLDESTPTGYIIIAYQGKALGFVKNMGNRSNNLYPQEWRIRYL